MCTLNLNFESYAIKIMDLSYFAGRVPLIGSVILGVLLLICSIVGRFKSDPAYYKLFLLGAPPYAAYLLLYLLPFEAMVYLNVGTSVHLKIIDDIFGPTRGVLLVFTVVPTFILAATVYLWKAVKSAHDECYRKSRGRRVPMKQSDYEVGPWTKSSADFVDDDLDEHPYRPRSDGFM
jgi:hypothetical protein